MFNFPHDFIKNSNLISIFEIQSGKENFLIFIYLIDESMPFTNKVCSSSRKTLLVLILEDDKTSQFLI